MKRNIIIMCMLMMAFSIFSYSQTVSTKAPLSSEEYMKKSKDQKITAWVFLVSGTAVLVTGISINSQEELSFEDATTAGVLIGAGLLMEAISIPFFISAGSNKRKGMEATTQIMLQPTPPELRNISISPVMPGATVTFRF